MTQLGALIWLKWVLFRNALRSPKAVVSRLASTLVMLGALAISLGLAVLLGLATYTLMSEEAGHRLAYGGARSGEQLAGVVLVWAFVVLYMMWGVVPLGLGGGSQFDAGRLLLYPVSLKRLFAIDWLSELLSLSSVCAAPVVVGAAIGAGSANGQVAGALVVACCAIAFGVAFAKLLSTLTGILMRSKRTRGETLLALLGAGFGIFGAFFGRLVPALARSTSDVSGLRWTPPGAVAAALTEGLRPGGAGVYAASLTSLLAYTCIFIAVTYRVARRVALGIGGGSKHVVAAASEAKAAGISKGEYGGWHLPFISTETAAVVEKELRYALRNAQLRVIAVMAVVLSIAVRVAPVRERGNPFHSWQALAPYMEGAFSVFSVLYIFTMLSPLTSNSFGFDGAGMRSLVLAPADRRKFLIAKNIAHTLIALLLATVGVLVNGLVFRDLTPPAVVCAALSFVIYAALFALGGNWLSLRFPKRMTFGKRMNRSGVAGLLMAVLFLFLLLPPAVAILVAYAARSLIAKYVILVAFAVLSSALYVLLIGWQGRTLQRREIEIMEAVTGRGGDDAGQILGS